MAPKLACDTRSTFLSYLFSWFFHVNFTAIYWSLEDTRKVFVIFHECTESTANVILWTRLISSLVSPSSARISGISFLASDVINQDGHDAETGVLITGTLARNRWIFSLFWTIFQPWYFHRVELIRLALFARISRGYKWSLFSDWVTTVCNHTPFNRPHVFSTHWSL